jgi:ABC-type transporter Mla maintaining outer membrane lipid asymmetry permease subunit MlaE
MMVGAFALPPIRVGMTGPLSPGYWAMCCYGAALTNLGASSISGSLVGLALFTALGVALSASLVRSRSS